MINIGREELGTETRHVGKAGERGVCCADITAIFRIHEAVDPTAQLGWKSLEAERRGHSGGGNSRRCSETAGFDGSQCSDGRKSFGTF